MNVIEKYVVSISTSIREAVKKMDVHSIESVIVTDGDKVIGLFTIGDFRRAVLGGIDINNDVSKIINRNFKFLNENYKEDEVREIFNQNDMIVDLPVLNKKHNLLDIVTRDKYFSTKELAMKQERMSKIPVVIMAGGKGTRMDPFTRILPKPLVPLGNEPAIKVIMDKFKLYGFNDFHISIKDKGQMIKAYFHDHNLSYLIKYIEEDNPLGTAGALLKLKNKFSNTFVVSNCDIIMNADYFSIMEFHEKEKYDITLVASMRHYVIPYGVCDVDKVGSLKSIKEKPEYDFLVNTGFYVLQPELINLIPENTYFDMTDLIYKAQSQGFKIGVFPVSEKSWIDIGQWNEYTKLIDDFKLIHE